MKITPDHQSFNETSSAFWKYKAIYTPTAIRAELWFTILLFCLSCLSKTFKFQQNSKAVRRTNDHSFDTKILFEKSKKMQTIHL